MILAILLYDNTSCNADYYANSMFENQYSNYAIYNPYPNVNLYVNLDRIIIFQADVGDDYEKNGFKNCGNNYWVKKVIWKV